MVPVRQEGGTFVTYLLCEKSRTVSGDKQPRQDLRRESRGVPNVSDLQAGNQGEGLEPVGTRIRRDRGVRVALGPLLHIARFGGAVLIEAGSVAPLGVEFDPIRRVCHHQQRLRTPASRIVTSLSLVASAHSTRCGPRSHRSPGPEIGCSGTAG